MVSCTSQYSFEYSARVFKEFYFRYPRATNILLDILREDTFYPIFLFQYWQNRWNCFKKVVKFVHIEGILARRVPTDDTLERRIKDRYPDCWKEIVDPYYLTKV